MLVAHVQWVLFVRICAVHPSYSKAPVGTLPSIKLKHLCGVALRWQVYGCTVAGLRAYGGRFTGVYGDRSHGSRVGFARPEAVNCAELCPMLRSESDSWIGHKILAIPQQRRPFRSGVRAVEPSFAYLISRFLPTWDVVSTEPLLAI